MRIEVDQNKVKSMLNEGVSVYKIARVLNIPESIPYRIRQGKDVPFFKRKGMERKGDQYCECCMTRKKAPGFRKLCKYCSENADTGSISPELSLGRR